MPSGRSHRSAPLRNTIKETLPRIAPQNQKGGVTAMTEQQLREKLQFAYGNMAGCNPRSF